MSGMGWPASISEELGVGEGGREVRRVGAGGKLSPSMTSGKEVRNTGATSIHRQTWVIVAIGIQIGNLLGIQLEYALDRCP